MQFFVFLSAQKNDFSDKKLCYLTGAELINKIMCDEREYIYSAKQFVCIMESLEGDIFQGMNLKIK